MTKFQSKINIDKKVIKQIIALIAKNTKGVKSVYALKNDKLNNRYDRFLKVSHSNDLVDIYIVLSKDEKFDEEEIKKNLLDKINSEIYLSLGMKVKSLSIEFI